MKAQMPLSAVVRSDCPRSLYLCGPDPRTLQRRGGRLFAVRGVTYHPDRTENPRNYGENGHKLDARVGVSQASADGGPRTRKVRKTGRLIVGCVCLFRHVRMRGPVGGKSPGRSPTYTCRAFTGGVLPKLFSPVTAEPSGRAASAQYACAFTFTRRLCGHRGITPLLATFSCRIAAKTAPLIAGFRLDPHADGVNSRRTWGPGPRDRPGIPLYRRANEFRQTLLVVLC